MLLFSGQLDLGFIRAGGPGQAGCGEVPISWVIGKTDLVGKRGADSVEWVLGNADEWI